MKHSTGTSDPKVVLGVGAKGDLKHPELTQAQLDERNGGKAMETTEADGE